MVKNKIISVAVSTVVVAVLYVLLSVAFWAVSKIPAPWDWVLVAAVLTGTAGYLARDFNKFLNQVDSEDEETKQ
jgi:hypothetical protein